jgi:hypothetical protein
MHFADGRLTVSPGLAKGRSKSVSRIHNMGACQRSQCVLNGLSPESIAFCERPGPRVHATVVPNGDLGYLTLWPDGESRPVVSTLNAADGAITSNMAIVPTMNGSIDAYAAGLTQVILDISGYFAP